MKMDLSRFSVLRRIQTIGLVFLALMGLWLGLAPAQAQTPGYSLKTDWPVTELTGKAIDPAAVKAGVLIDPTGKLDVVDVAQREDFAQLDPYRNFVLGRDGAAWLRLRLHIPAGSKTGQATRGSDLTTWILEIPTPLLDEVQLYQMGADERLLPVQKAGDIFPNAQWSYPSNVASFKLDLYAGDSANVWIKVKYPIVTQLPIMLKTEQQYLHDSRSYFWVIGLVSGALFFLCLYVFIIIVTFKDQAHLGFLLYLSTSLATLFAYSGINGYMLFSHSARWIDASTGVWQLFSAAAAMFFVGSLLQAPTRAPRLTWAMKGLAAFAILSVPTYFFAERASVGSSLVFLALTISYALCISMGVIAWRSGDKTGRIIVVFNGLLMLNLVVTLVGATGVLRFFWYQQAPVYALMIVLLPLILAEMNFKMRHQLAMQIRAQGMRTHDALTDSLNEPFFVARLRTIMSVPRKRRGAALVLIDVSNLPYMRESFAPEVIEQTLLRAVIKIKRIFGDMDAIGRVGDHRLAVLLENADRERVGKLCVELIASGLMPSKNLKQDITIVFHFAVALLEDYPGSAEDLLPQLQALCEKMSPRTQRPIRYLNLSAAATPSSQSRDAEAAPHSGFANSRSSVMPPPIASQGDTTVPPTAAAAVVRSGSGHHAVHTSPAPLSAAPSTLPPGLHSSGSPSSGAAPSSSFHA